MREEGLNEIENIILNEGMSDKAKAFVNGIGAVRYTIGDKMGQVAQRSMQLLMNLCRSCRPNISNQSLKGELHAYTEPILTSLNDKLGDNLAKVRSVSEDSFLSMADHPNFGV